MSTMQFLNAILAWLQADPSHVVVLASALAAITPTPAPATLAGRIYKVLDLLALNFLHAKNTGVALPDVAQQVAAILAQQKAAPASIAAAKEDPQ